MKQTATQSRPTWNQLSHRQKLAAFCMDQDNMEQNGCSKAESWEHFKDCFETEAEFEAMMADLNRQAAAFEVNSEDWKATMSEFLKAGR
jgi:hypothetical protein